MKKEKILVAVDGSEYSEKVLERAIALAKLFTAPLLLVHCHKRFPSVLGEPYFSEGIAMIIREAEKRVAPYLEMLRDSGVVGFEERLLEGPPGEAIANAAKIEGCDLIVMGSRGLSNLEGLIVGSVTHRVLHLAPCSVFVVK